MSPAAGGGSGSLSRLLGSPVRAAYLACVVVFLWAVAQFHDPATGFTSLISIGDAIDNRQTSALRAAPHYVYEESAGYDGAYYVQLALDPTLASPELPKVIDNLQYRARRILFCWVAWALGLGQPAWILQAHALLNVFAWLALGWVLLRWFPATGWENFLRWFAVMFSQGLCMSVRDSLVDGPALLLVALALAAWENGWPKRGAVLLALAGLGRETSVLAMTGAAGADWRAPRTWLRRALVALGIVMPLLLWIVWLRWKFGPPDETGLNNFTLPLAGLGGKWRAIIGIFDGRGAIPAGLAWGTLAVTLALTVQGLFFLLRWRPDERWWRVGVAFAVLMLFVSTPVWEGFPGAAARALLPMTLAFNVLVPRSRRWLPLLVAGNLTVVAAVNEFSPPARDFFQVTGERELTGGVQVKQAGWHGPEHRGDLRWRWSAGESSLRIFNQAGRPLTMVLRGRAAAMDERTLRVFSGETLLWSGGLAPKPAGFHFGFVLAPGETALRFFSDKPGRTAGEDRRTLAFDVFNLEIVVEPGPAQR